jgi:hypothetical protein
LTGKPEGRRPLGKTVGVDEMIALKWINERWSGVDWIQLIQDRNNRGTLVNAAMNLRVPYKTGRSWLPEQLLASHEELYGVSE